VSCCRDCCRGSCWSCASECNGDSENGVLLICDKLGLVLGSNDKAGRSGGDCAVVDCGGFIREISTGTFSTDEGSEATVSNWEEGGELLITGCPGGIEDTEEETS